MNIDEIVPKEVYKIDLKKDEVLVWSLDFEQYKFINTEQLKTISDYLEYLFPNNKVIVTIGKVDISTIKAI